MGIRLQSLGPLTVLSAFPPPPNPMTFILPSIPYPQAGKRQDFISPMPYASYTISWFTYHIKSKRGLVCFEHFPSAFPERGCVLISTARRMFHLFH